MTGEISGTSVVVTTNHAATALSRADPAARAAYEEHPRRNPR